MEMTITPTLNKKSGKGMIHGVVSELTTFFTVRPGHEEAMRAAVERVNQRLHEMGPDVHRKIGLREWRMVILDNGQRLMLMTGFETDWDPYIDDALQVFGVDFFIDWLQHTIEAERQAKALQPTIAAVRRGEANTTALTAGVKALLQSAQVQATAYFDVLSDQTVPQIRKAQQVERAFEQVLDDSAAAQALKQPALKPLLEQAAD
jgi:hypothetical protein